MPASSNAAAMSPNTSVLRTSTAISLKSHSSRMQAPGCAARRTALRCAAAASASSASTPMTSTATRARLRNARPATRLRGSMPSRAGGDGFDGAENFRRGCGNCPPVRPDGRRCSRPRLRYSAKPLRLGVAEAEDGLIDVAHGIEAVGRPHQPQQLRLLPVGVLKLVHQDVVELRAQAGAALRDVLRAGARRTLRGRRNRARRPARLRSR